MSDTAVAEYVKGNPFRAPEPSSYACIRPAALALFANHGVAATSIRMVAKAADVSPGVVQHHYRSKERLRAAVDRWVSLHATSTFAHIPDEVDRVVLGRILRDFVADNPLPLRYLARGDVDREPGTLDVFDTYVGLAARFLPARAARDLVVRTLSAALFDAALAGR